MPIELPSDLEVIDERLRSLEDRVLAERLFQDNPELFSEPPQTERQVLAWATRRFGTAVIAVTAAVSIAAGYLLGPLVIKHDRPSPAAPVTSAAAVVVRPQRPAVQHRAKPAAPVHTARTAPVLAAPVVRHVAPVAHHAALLYPPVHHHPAVAVPVPNQAAEHERALQAELARQRRAAAARRAHANATARQSAVRTETAPRTQPRTETATGVATATATATGPTDVPVSTQPADVPAPSGNPKSPVTNPGGVWSEHPPLATGPYGNQPGSVMADPCTPRRGRLGAVLDTLQRASASSGGRIHF